MEEFNILGGFVYEGGDGGEIADGRGAGPIWGPVPIHCVGRELSRKRKSRFAIVTFPLTHGPDL
ncbi:hypothetical protein CRENBAI_016723, partial [Crenichthys baileyi]